MKFYQRLEKYYVGTIVKIS